ncbi:integrating conjugative element protein [Pseudomonas fluorescens]|uniref:integrating conjugative element protein n=1 Tax=Pseudomonas fluorescens TaxID=294 RepID=UPI001BE850C9|nr:integrating conjugative element protein [Pseudomonas fluorescens]MBT2375322.1 integrating conjugative element protein [Pseudomonas fluorescens]
MKHLLMLALLLALFASAATPPVRNAPYSEADMLPVKTITLSPGKVASRPMATPGLPALFLIGDDPLSRAWLQRRLPALQQLKAVGLVVQVASVEQLERLRAMAPGLSLYPASADDLAQRLTLSHYPVLITATAIEQ